MLDTLAEKLELQVEQEELTEHLIRRAQQSQMSPQDYANQIMQSNSIGVLMAEVLRGKALAHVLDAAEITDASGNTVQPVRPRRAVPASSRTTTHELFEETGELYDTATTTTRTPTRPTARPSRRRPRRSKRSPAAPRSATLARSRAIPTRRCPALSPDGPWLTA